MKLLFIILTPIFLLYLIVLFLDLAAKLADWREFP